MTKLPYVLTALCAAFFLATAFPAAAMQESRPVAGEPRLRVITYNPNAIHHYIGHYVYQGSILFGKDEKILTVSLGNPAAWQVLPKDNRLFLKPIAVYPEHTVTNMMVITEKRTYYFQLEGRIAENINDPQLAWETRFVYPEGDSAGDSLRQYAPQSASEPDLTDLSRYNFNYTISGNEFTAPIRVFDDGEFTYLEYPDVNVDLPAIFLVDSQNKEAIVNFHVAGKYVVIERVAGRFTLRHGNDVTCLFNENWASPKSLPAALH
ncbi:MAG: TrbG/VirB9 family P-type conjugative transfer protein [Rickettsiales bacterium]